MNVGEGPEDGGPRSLSFLGAAGWALLVEVLFLLVVQVAESFRQGAMADIVTLTAGRLVAFGLVLFAILRLYTPESSIRTVLAVRAPRALHAVLGVLVGAALAPGASWLNDVMARRFPPSAEELAALEQLLAAETIGKRIILVVTLGVVLPVADELFFRGVLFTQLERRRTSDAVLLTVAATAIFDTLLLASMRGIPAMLAMAVVLGVLRVRARSVLPAAAARVAFFCVSLSSIALGRPEWEVSWRLALGSTALAAVLLALSVRVRPRAADPMTDTAP